MCKRTLPILCVMLGLLTGCLETIEEAVDKNQPPRANAGEDQTLELAGETVMATLDGSESEDKDGEIVEYIWRAAISMPIVVDAGVGDGGGFNGGAGQTGGEDDAGTEDAGSSDEAGTDQGLLAPPDPADVVRPEVSLGEGVHTFNLWVVDNSGAFSVPDAVEITVVPPAEP